MADKNTFPLLFFEANPETVPYESTQVIIKKEYKTFPRNRSEHGLTLKRQVESVKEFASSLQNKRKLFGIEEKQGVRITITGNLGYDFIVNQIENRRLKFEIVVEKNISKQSDQSTPSATVLIPYGKLESLIKMIEKYANSEENQKYTRQDLFNSINEIKIASFLDLWTSEPEHLPTEDKKVFWEVWIRTGRSSRNQKSTVSNFLSNCEKVGLYVSKNKLSFAERTVFLVQGTSQQLREAVELLDLIAEIRKPSDTVELITHAPAFEQNLWQDEMIDRIEPPTSQAPAVCILDTGVNYSHPLIKLATDENKCTAYNVNWGAYDHEDIDGHGTPMAGICLYGDLFENIINNKKVYLTHFLESVKILSPTTENPNDLIGYIHNSSASKIIVNDPNRNRIFCLTVTRNNQSKNFGYPSSASSSMDNLCFGLEDSIKKLFCISSGNSDLIGNVAKAKEYPTCLDTELIEDPAQAWNALTIGAYTEKETGKSIATVAKKGEVSPYSSTSVSWTNKSQLPIKPDIVLEGGNLSFESDTRESDTSNALPRLENTPDKLQILTTGKRLHNSPFTTVTGTSPAAALAANYCAKIRAAYPSLWEESIRALMIHSATWTDNMKTQYLKGKELSDCTVKEKEHFLRSVGYGVPNLSECINCMKNSVTIVAQDQIQPFKWSEKSKSAIFNDVHFYEIPFPEDILQQLGSVNAKLTITLSYFIEANPKTKSKRTKYTYASHGLRFATKKSLETPEAFKKRVNTWLREEDENKSKRSEDLEGWTFKSDLRKRGSVHKDIWTGTCAELARKNLIAIHPVSGWWKYRHHLKRYDEITRYCLVVTLETDSVETDIYTPIMNQLKISEEVRVSFL